MDSVAQRTKVIVADARQEAAESLAAFLADQGFEARAVSDGGDAIIAAEAWPADRAVLAMPLAGVSGFEVARHLRQSFGPSFLLVAYTSWSTDTDRARLSSAGFDRIVARVESPEEVLAALSEAGRTLIMRSVAQTVRRMELLIVLGHSLLGSRQVKPASSNVERARRIVDLVKHDIALLPDAKERERMVRELDALCGRVPQEPITLL